MKKFFVTYQDYVALFFLWLLLILIINPTGDFPLNDDWCYGKSVKTLTEQGYLKLYNWGEMTLVGQVLWGTIFTKIFGFSFTVLRWSTLFLGFATLVGIYKLCTQIGMARWTALVAVLLCILNPIFLSLSFSFMTDIPFLCVTIWTIYFFTKALQTQQWQPIVWAIFFSFLAFSIRQLAWVFPLVWMLTVMIVRPRNLKNICKAFAPLLSMLVFSALFSAFMEANDLLQDRYNTKFNLLLDSMLHPNTGLLLMIVSYLFQSLTYIGLFLLPIHLWSLRQYKCKGSIFWAVSWTVGISAYLIKFDMLLPSLDNIWINFGVGPTTLYDYAGNFTESPNPTAPRWFWLIITCVGVLSSVALLFRLRTVVNAIFQKKKIAPTSIFALVFFCVYLTPFLIVGVYDRYLLPLFPIAIVFLASNKLQLPTRSIQYVTYGFLGVLAWFSISAVHDHLAWNRVRWKVLNELTETIPKQQIQGGVEYVTWYFFSEDQEKWWEQVAPTYMLVFEPKKDQNVLETYTYDRWLPGKGVMYLVE